MSNRSNRSIGVWAEAQRQRQRQLEAHLREQRSAERELARSHREQQTAYRQRREADARRRTQELDSRVESLTRLLAVGCRAPAFRTTALLRSEQLEPFAPGRLAVPVRMPQQSGYQPQSGWGFGSGRRAQEAQARYERDLRAARAAEAQRQQQLTAHGRQYDSWRAAQLAEIRRHNAGIAENAVALRRGDADTVVEYFSAALYASTAWPEGFPRQVSCAYDPAGRRLVLNWELPGYDIVPGAKSVRYLVTADQDKETARPVGQRRAVYRDVVAQCVLLALRELFAADEFGTLDSVTLNGFVDDHDPSTGQRAQLFLATVLAERLVFGRLNLGQVSAVDCLVDGLGGRLSARPDQRAVVRPGAVPDDFGRGMVSRGGEEDPDLFEMDPVEFESLVADLFRARGMQAVMTQRSNDGGVDVEALDPDPISGGTIIVQVKRYRHTVPPTAVRDLFGTVQGAGANKGVLVTTSGFGPGSYTFANGKPLTLISGTELVDLLGRHGLRGRLGGGAGVPAQRGTPAAADPVPAGEYNVLGMDWSGSVALDVCALVCRGNRALSDDHFVFFNNARTPDGTVCAIARPARDKAAIRVAFDALPASADRLVLAVSIDPEVNPRADLSGFTDAFIRLSDGSGAELGRLEVSDGRSGETALILGSFRRRASGDWDFVMGGKGYEGGLEALVLEYGIDVG
ncbi:restriction endonuclease [Streptomyces sp. H10-C2]|uniref:restriction endonuclease n=1 Tax=unclassified Streptomyces TaxID=2593676 RepID=UPI0024BBE4AC|nr:MULTISPECIES: restriction endonuclease [unclassified Streptomyces]MDJ0340909.1 restriction endonuclease [Streptomyces sp. PH10-H1]MDJ0369859.1 restriction endonuclease [Streptomyces sp. H10-C2]